MFTRRAASTGFTGGAAIFPEPRGILLAGFSAPPLGGCHASVELEAIASDAINANVTNMNFRWGMRKDSRESRMNRRKPRRSRPSGRNDGSVTCHTWIVLPEHEICKSLIGSNWLKAQSKNLCGNSLAEVRVGPSSENSVQSCDSWSLGIYTPRGHE